MWADSLRRSSLASGLGHKLVPGVDYPRSQMELSARFGTDDSCAEYLAAVRWQNGFRCPSPRCYGREASTVKHGYRSCRSCGRRISPIYGTPLAGSKKPLHIWFQVIWLMAAGSVSARRLQSLLGIGSYQTAWTIMNKIRSAMTRLPRTPLCGVVEVGETTVVAMSAGRRAEAVVLLAVEVEEGVTKRVRAAHIQEQNASTLQAFIQDVVAPWSTVRTTVGGAYGDLRELGYVHEQVASEADDGSSRVPMPNFSSAVSSLRRSLVAYAGAADLANVNGYLAEFTFRVNAGRKVGPRFYWLTRALLREDDRHAAKRLHAHFIWSGHPLASLASDIGSRRGDRGRRRRTRPRQ